MYLSQTFSARAAVLVTGLGLVLGIGLASGTVNAADRIDAEADKVVKAMTTYLNNLPAFSVNIDVEDEVLDTRGQKLQLSASASLVVKRPSGIYAHRRGPLADMELFVDGKQMTLYGKGLNIFARWETGGNIDGAIDQLRVETGLEVAAADLFYADAYAGLMDGVVSGDYVGTGMVNGVQCHHLAFRKDRVDWQLWVQTGDAPLPMKYIITSKWLTAAPQYSARFRDWNTQPEIGADRFTFTAPMGAKQIQEIRVDEVGNVSLGEDQ